MLGAANIHAMLTCRISFCVLSAGLDKQYKHHDFEKYHTEEYDKRAFTSKKSTENVAYV